MKSVADHPNKHIREAVQYALSSGWTLRKAGPRAHTWGVSIVHKATGQAASEPSTRHRDIQKTMRTISGEPSIGVHTLTESSRGQLSLVGDMK